MAEAAATALDAKLVAIEIAEVEGNMVVWDAQPVPEYRAMRPLGSGSVDQALSEYVARVAGVDSGIVAEGGRHLTALIRREALDGVALSA